MHHYLQSNDEEKKANKCEMMDGLNMPASEENAKILKGRSRIKENIKPLLHLHTYTHSTKLHSFSLALTRTRVVVCGYIGLRNRQCYANEYT